MNSPLSRLHCLHHEEDTQRLAADVAAQARRGDVILLSGEIGAGKSVFARAFIRARLDAPGEDVPSPTFTIVQTYADPRGDIWHMDLYRLTNSDEVYELGIEEAFETGICLIEWPDRLGADSPADALQIEMQAGPEQHTAMITATANWTERLGWTG